MLYLIRTRSVTSMDCLGDRVPVLLRDLSNFILLPSKLHRNIRDSHCAFLTHKQTPGICSHRGQAAEQSAEEEEQQHQQNAGSHSHEKAGCSVLLAKLQSQLMP